MDAQSQKQTPGIAIASLVCGILAIAACLGPLAGIPAIIMGHMAYSRIRKNADTLKGEGMALAGLITGYVSLAILVFIVPMMAAIAIPAVMRARTTSQKSACINNLRQIEAAKDQYALDQGKPNGWAEWDGKAGYEEADDEPAFTTLTTGEGYLKQFPLCPASESSVQSAEQAAADYNINPIGVSAECAIRGNDPKDPHALAQ